MSTTIEKIQRQIAENPILLYMKGSPKLPSCGFSAQAVQALSACGERFAYVDILQNPDIRAELPKYANWPTFPQLWVDGELVGGCDILIEMYQRGELQQLIKETAAKYKTEEPDAARPYVRCHTVPSVPDSRQTPFPPPGTLLTTPFAPMTDRLMPPYQR